MRVGHIFDLSERDKSGDFKGTIWELLIKMFGDLFLIPLKLENLYYFCRNILRVNLLVWERVGVGNVEREV